MRYGHGRLGLVARLGKVPLIGLVLLAANGPAGCRREAEQPRQVEPAGSIGLNLTAAPGVTLNSVTYTITGNGFTKTGAIDTSSSPTISGTIGGIPAGKGYTITLTARSVGGRHDVHRIGDLRRDRGSDDVGDHPSERRRARRATAPWR